MIACGALEYIFPKAKVQGLQRTLTVPKNAHIRFLSLLTRETVFLQKSHSQSSAKHYRNRFNSSQS